MLKKWMALLLVFLLAWPAALAEEPMMEQYAAQIAAELHQLANDPYYAQINGIYGYYSGQVLLEEYAACTWSKPTHDVYLSMDEAGMVAALLDEGITDAQFVLEMYRSSLITMQLQRYTSSETLTVGNVLQNNICYTDPAQPDGWQIFLRFFEDGAPVLYSLTSLDGAVCLSCQVLVDEPQQEEAQITVYGEMPEWLQELIGDTDVMVRVVSEQPEVEAAPGSLSLADCQNAQDVTDWLAEKEIRGVLASDEPVVMPVIERMPKGESRVDIAIQLAREAAQLMDDPARLEVYGATEDTAVMLNTWSGKSEGEPRLMVELPIDLRTHGAVSMGVNVLFCLNANPDGPAARLLERQLAGAMCTQLVGLYAGIDEIVAYSISSYGGMLITPDEPDSTGMYLLLYEGGGAMAVSWFAEGGVTSMQALYLPIDELAECETALDVSLLLMSKGIPMSCTEIPID